MEPMVDIQPDSRLDSRHDAEQRFRTSILTSERGIKRVLELRARCFAREFAYDQFERCADHLVVEDVRSGAIVGAYRLVSSKRIATFESERYFQMTPWLKRQRHAVELGWACVREDYRQGAVVARLWRGLSAYFANDAVDAVFGPTGVTGGTTVELQRLMVFLRAKNFDLVDSGIHALHGILGPRPDSIDVPSNMTVRSLPKMLRAYLASGARVLLDPVYDSKSQCFDLMTVLQLSRS